MITVHACSGHIFGCKSSDHGIILLAFRRVQKTKYFLYIFQTPYPRKHGQYSRLVQCILDALAGCQRLPKGRRVFIQQLPAGIRLHNRNSYSFCLTAAIKLHPLAGTASRIVPMLVIVGRIDRKHQLIHNSCIQNQPGKRRRMRRQTDMFYYAGSFHLLQILKYPIFLIILPVRLCIQTMDKSIINVICFQLLQLPVYLAPDSLQIRCPSIFSRFIIRSEMDLIKQFLPHRSKCLSCIPECFCPCRCKIYIIDPIFKCI